MTQIFDTPLRLDHMRWIITERTSDGYVPREIRLDTMRLDQMGWYEPVDEFRGPSHTVNVLNEESHELTKTLQV